MTMTATPAAPSLLPGEDTGASNSDGVINLSGPLLTGQTAPNAVITLYDNGVVATTASAGMDAPGTTTADVNGFYTIFPYPLLDDGKHSLTITATAPDETASLYSPPLAIVVDTSAPDAPTAPVLAAGFDTGVSAEDGITDKNILRLTGTTEPNAMLALFNGSSTTPLAQVMAGTDGSYTLQTNVLADGVYSLTVKAMDLAGNISMASASTSITVDTAAPAVPAAPTLSPGTDTGVSHSDGLTDDATPVVMGTAEANSTVMLYDGGKLIVHAQADGSGNYAITTPTLDDGAHTLTVAAQDAAGNTSAASAALNVVVDTEPATGASTAEANQAIFGSVPFTLHFSEAISGVTLQALKLVATGTAGGEVAAIAGSGSDYTVTVDGLSGVGTLALALAPGAAVTDEAGNPVSLTTSQSYEIANQDAPDPIVVGSYPFDGTDGVIATSFSGRLVAFDSTAAQTPVATASGQDLYVSDLRTGGLTQITADGYSGLAALSSNGTTMVFVSTADDLVPGSPTDGAANVYVAHLSTSNVPGGQAVTVSSIQLVSQGNGADGIDGFTQSALPNEEGPDPRLGSYEAPAISADGTHVAFVSSQALIDGVTAGTANVYEEDLATGDLTLISTTPGGTAGNAGSDEPSLSSDGSKVAFESGATDLTDTPSPAFTEQSYVYDNTTNTLTQLNAAAQLGFTYEAGFYGPAAIEPKINALGNWATYTIQVIRSAGSENQISFVVNQNIVNGKLELLTPDTLYNYDDQSNVSYGGRYVSYTGNDLGYIDNQAAYQVVVQDAVSGTNNAVGSGYAPVLTSDGNAVAFLSPLYSAPDSNGFITQLGGQFLVETLGPTVGINPVGGNDEIGAAAWKQALASGLVVTGVTDAPDGSTVQLLLINQATGATVSTLQGIAVAGGAWMGTLAASDLAGLPDGQYKLNAVAGATNGASFPSNRLLTVDTMPPVAPDAPKLGAGSDTSMASDGSATSQDMPIITGTAEAGSTVTLYDASGITPMAIGTAVADGSGIYAITAATLKDGKHTLDVTATDAAGNVSAASGTLAITVDRVAPTAPTAGLEPASDTGSSHSDRITSNATPNVVGTAQAGTTVTLYDTDSKTMLGTATVKADGTYTIAASQLAEGAHTLTVTDTDVAGNVSPASDPIAVTVDTLPPLQPTISSITGPLVAGDITPLVTVNGTAEPNSRVTLVLDGGMGADSVFGATTAASDGDYSINSDYLPAGDGQNLTTIATDAAGNASQPSLAADVNITGSATPPPGLPADAPTLLGLLTDGPIAGATVFADANGNGVQDPAEAAAVTTTAGQFTLYNPSGELIATGGVDTTTGLTPLGELTAPAGSTVITPLTTLLDAYAAGLGETPQVAQPALLVALGLAPVADLTQLDPAAVAAGGDLSFLIASASVMDTAVDFADLIAAQTGASQAAAFAAVFAALAQQAATGSLNLVSVTTMQAVLANAAAIAVPGAVLPPNILQVSAYIAQTGNYDLSTAGNPRNGVTSPGFIAAVERVEQGQAAPLYAASADDPASNVAGLYTYDLGEQVTAAETPVLAAPVLAPGQDTGISPYDNDTSITDPVFIGTAAPGATVLIAASYHAGVVQPYSIVGSGTANADGVYSITAQLSTTFSDVVAIQAAPGEVTALGSPISVPNLPASKVTLVIAGNLATTKYGLPKIQDVSYVASSANDATHSAIYIDGIGSVAYQPDGIYTLTADGNPTPLGTSSARNGYFGIVSSPLANGPHSLVVTETFGDGETLQSLPFTVTVTAPSSITLDAQATGPVIGGAIFGIEDSSSTLKGLGGNLLAGGQDNFSHPESLTDGTGTVTVPTLFNVPDQEDPTGNGVDLTHGTVELVGGEDRLTGLPLPSDLLAPPGSTVINPVTTLVATAIADADLGPVGPPPVTAAEIAFETGRVAHDLDLASTLDLLTADPLAMAEAGDPSLLLKDIELLDTVTLLAPFVPSPFTAIDKSVPLSTFGNVFTPQPVTNAPIDFTSAAEVLSWLTTNRQNFTSVDASVLPQAAAIIAASNAAIEAHAKTATSLADTLSYALAVQRVAQGTEAQALAQSAADGVLAEQQAEFTALQAAYTGSGLNAAVAATLADTVQVTGFAPLVASTGAARADFSLTFSAPATGLTTANFAMSTSSGLLGGAVTSVTPVAGSDDTAYTVAVSTGVGQGTLTLGFTPDGLAGQDGIPLTGGLFTPVQTYASPSADGSSFGTGLAVGDFNGDGRLDVAQAVNGGADSSGSITLFLGQGDGTFVAQPSVYAEPLNPGALVAGDFNGDGKLDLVTLDRGGGTFDLGRDAAGEYNVAVLLGNGNGTFGQPIQTEVGTVPPLEITTGDFNGDGKLDLAVLVASPSGYGVDATVQIYLGNGDGSLTAGATVDAGDAAYTNYVSSIAEADLNGDGNADLVVGTVGKLSLTPSVSVLLGDGHGGFTLAAQPALTFSGDNSGGSLVAVGDLNGDRIPDIVVLPSYPAGAPDANGAIPATLDVLLGRGDGTFGPATSVALPLPPVFAGEVEQQNDMNLSVAIGDVTGDDMPDIVVNNEVSGEIVLPGLGNGSFGIGYFTTADQGESNGGSSLALADVNGDGRLDLLTSSDGSEAGSSLGLGIGVALNTAQTVLPASATVTVSRPAVAQPVLSKASGAGTLTQTGTSYTLNLGTLREGAASSVALALANTAAAPADSFDGLFSTSSGSGFVVTGTDLPQAVAAGSRYAGLSFAADTSAPGTYSETITFAPRDVTAAAAPAAADPDTGLVTADAAPNPDAVALELSPITLTVTDTVLASGASVAPATLAAVAPVVLANVRVRAVDAAALSLANAASAPAANLDVTAAASGAASVSGAIAGLTPGGTDAADLTVGLNTATAGALSGTVTLTPVSDVGGVTTPLAAVQVPVSGSVFRAGAAIVAPVSAIVHVGGSGSVALPIGNGDPADGFSESLIATIASVTPGLTVVGGGLTADIAPGATNRSLVVSVATAAAGTVSGSVTLALTSDGGAVDGLGTLALAAAAVPITVTVDNYAQATLVATGATLSGGVLNLGAVQQGSAAVTATLDTVNSAAGPADALGGSYTLAASSGFADSGFAAFSGDGTGQADTGGTITLQTGRAGMFSQTIVLHSAASNASGYSGALADQTVTVEGTVVAAGTPVGSVITTPASLSVAQGAPATTIGITAPIDTAFSAGQLSITLGALPTDGTVTLADGMAVSTGEILTALQLTGLQFIAVAGVSGVSSTLGYTVSDPSGSVASGSATLAVLTTAAAVAAPTLLLTPPANGPEAASPATSKAISNDPTPPVAGVAADGAQVALTSGATAAGGSIANPSTGAYGTALAASLGLGFSAVTATATTAAGTSPASAPASVYEIPGPIAGVSSPDISSLNMGVLFDQGYGLQFVGGTEAAALVDGTLSVGPDTNEAYLQRLYEGLFGRNNDPMGMQYWDDLLAINTLKSAIASDFMATPEYQAAFPNQAQQSDAQFVSQLYQSFLGRAPTSGDQAFWGGVAEQYGRQYVLADIADSAEAKTNLAATTAQVWGRSTDGTLVHELYEAGLAREAELPGLAFWKNTLQTGALTPLTLAQTLSTQPEFVALHAGQSDASYIASLYTADFGRPPDAAGAAFWGSALAAGTLTRAGVLLGVATSPEAQMDQTRNL